MDIQSETAEGTIKIKPTWYRNPKNKLQKPTTTEGIRFSLKNLNHGFGVLVKRTLCLSIRDQKHELHFIKKRFQEFYKHFTSE